MRPFDCGPGWNDACLACLGKRLDGPFVRVKSLVGDQRVRTRAWEEVIGACQIMGVAAGQGEPYWVPSASTLVWILVLNPARGRSIAWSCPASLGAGTMLTLMSTHDRPADHGVFTVGIGP